MSRQRRSRDRSLPGPVREAIGGAVLVGAIRTIDALWRRITGRPTPLEARRAIEDREAGEPAVVRDRLVYAALMGGAARLAERAGLTSKRPERGTKGERSEG